MGPGLNGLIFCFLILTFYATVVEMSPRHHTHKMARSFDDSAWVDDFESSLSAVNEADDADDTGRDAGDVDTALEDAQAAKVAAQNAAKKADKAVIGAKEVKAEQEEAKAEKEEEEAAKEQEEIEKEKEEEAAAAAEEEVAETTNPTDAGDVDTALEDAQAAAAAAKKAAKKADKAVVEAKEVKAEQEEAKAEKEDKAAKEKEENTSNTTESDNEQESARPTIGDDFLSVDLTESNITDIANLGLDEASTASSKTESKEINDWATHCFKGWDQYPCKLGFRHGCKQGICWSQCDAAWRLDWLTAEWCWVMQPKEEDQDGTADTSEWKYLDCDTDADCTKQYAYRRKCKGACSMGWMKLRS